MKERGEKAVADRRNFLKLAGLGTVVGGVALVAGGKPAEALDKSVGKNQIYRETDHVRTYYDLARF